MCARSIAVHGGRYCRSVGVCIICFGMICDITLNKYVILSLTFYIIHDCTYVAFFVCCCSALVVRLSYLVARLCIGLLLLLVPILHEHMQFSERANFFGMFYTVFSGIITRIRGPLA